MDGRLRATPSYQGHAVPNQELSDRRACDLERGGSRSVEGSLGS